MKQKLISKKVGKYQTPWAPLSQNFDYKDYTTNPYRLISTGKGGNVYDAINTAFSWKPYALIPAIDKINKIFDRSYPVLRTTSSTFDHKTQYIDLANAIKEAKQAAKLMKQSDALKGANAATQVANTVTNDK